MEETRLSYMQLASIARKLVEDLIKFRSDAIPESDQTLEDNLKMIAEIQEQYFEQGTNGILDKISTAVKKIQTIIERTAEISSVIHVDISDCISGKREELEALGKNLISNFINAATEVINKVTDKINDNINIVTNVTEELSNLPSQLGTKLLSMNTKVISEFVTYVQDLIAKLPDTLCNILSETSNFIQNLPSELLICVTNAIEKAEIDANDILNNTASSIGIKFKDAIVDYLLN